MEQIEQIYYNDFGVAFYWKRGGQALLEKIQLVFKETGFYFTQDELQIFICLINLSYNRLQCEGCNLKNNCGRFLLKTPCENVDLAVSMKELSEIKDLVDGTLFQIRLDNYLKDLCRN